MVRAIATMGAVAAIAGGITFASLTSNTVALSPNNITTSTATLAIGAGSSCPGGDTTSTTGFQVSSLAPGATSTLPFCLDNTGGVPLTVTVSIPKSLASSTAAQQTTLTITCPTEGTLSTTLGNWGDNSYAFPNPLPANEGAGSVDDCTASVSLSGNYNGGGGESITQFDIDFTGNQSS